VTTKPFSFGSNPKGTWPPTREPRLKGFLHFRPYCLRNNELCRGCWQENLCAYWQSGAWTYYRYHRNMAARLMND